MNDILSSKTLHSDLSLFLLLLSPTIFLILQYVVVAPFGKHSSDNKKWGPTINPKLAWALMESPNLLWSGYLYFKRDKLLFASWPNRILLSFFVIHYFNRCVVYPYRMSSCSQKMNISVMSSAFLFCSLNGYLQAQTFYQYQTFPEQFHLSTPFLVGSILWAMGFYINNASDATLRQLRQTPGYKIPRGGLFEYVSCANFAGEILEWFGYALACRTLAGWAFFLFVCANLIPRATSHHKWYVEKFKDYPLERKIVFPFIY